MKNPALLATVSLTALSLWSAPAFADVTAQDVFEAWKAQATSMGQTLTVGSEAMEGDTLVAKDITIAMTGPEGAGEGKFGEIRFKEMGDGTVSIILPESYPIIFSGTNADGGTAAGEVTVTSKGLNLLASGDPGAINYQIAAEQLGLTMTGVTTDGTEVPMSVGFTLNGVAGNYLTKAGSGLSFDANITAQSMDLNLQGSDPANPGETFSLTGSAQQIVLTESAIFPEGVNMENMAEALAKGFAISGNVVTGPVNYKISVSGAEPADIALSAASSNFDFAFASAGLKYAITTTGVDLSIMTPAMPPVAAKLDELTFGLTMPVVKSDAAQDLGLVVKLIGLTVGEEIWGMIDPGQVLPRDPATVIFDATGKGNWTVDILDPAVAEAMPGVPGNLESLTLNEVRVAAAGADVSGTGEFTFDNSMVEMGGPPMPLGSINLKAIGINGLMDNLVKMGLMPEDQLMGMKMMMGMFAKPGAEPDSLESLIEFKEGGQIFANGTPLQ